MDAIAQIERAGQAAVTRTEAARLLGIDSRTLNRAIEAGDVPVIRIGKIIRIPTSWLRQHLGV